MDDLNNYLGRKLKIKRNDILVIKTISVANDAIIINRNRIFTEFEFKKICDKSYNKTKQPKKQRLVKLQQSIGRVKREKQTIQIVDVVDGKEIEQWKVYVWNGITTNYDVSNLGNVRSLHKRNFHCLMNKRTNNKEKLLFCDLRINNKPKTCYVHKMVAEMFVKNQNPELFDKVTHINSNKQDNHWSNLRWTNQSEISSEVANRLENRFKLRDINIKNGYYEQLRNKTH